MATDIPYLDDSIVRLPNDLREALAERGRRDLYFFNKAVLGHRDLTEPCHGPYCAFADLNRKQFKLFLAPRDHLKTSAITIAGNMQKVVQDSENRMLLANESGTNASRFLRSIRQHAEGNRVFRALYSDVIPKDYRKVRWNDSELDFIRKGHYPEPTIDSIGMTGAFTSRHYTHITIDDPISEEAVKSELVMHDVMNRLSGFLSLLVDPSKDTIWLIGTRWALFDVYSKWIGDFGDKLGIIARGAIEYGDPIWPERFSLETLALKRKLMGEYKFSCLMMNRPRNSEIQDLNIEDIRDWKWKGDEEHLILHDNEGKEVREVALGQLDITATVDLAPAETITADRNAITVVGVTPWNEAVVLEAWGARCTPLQVIEKLLEIKSRWHPRVFGIEGVAYQKAFKYFLKQEADRRKVYLNIKELKAQNKKEMRIRGLQPLMATGRMYLLPTQHMLRNEISEFPLGEHDDVLDSLSMHLQLFRGQMSPDWWARYRQEEEKLINRIRRGQTGTRQIAKKDFDMEDDDEFAPKNQRRVSEVVID